MKPFLLIIMTMTFINVQANADATQNLLIEKLERINANLAPKDTSKMPVSLRLADLYAERARLAAMRELEAGCTVCKAGESDRAKALQLYQAVLSDVPASARGKVMVQMGHLFEIMGQENEAIRHYQTLLSESKSPEVTAEAHLSLAEIYFKKNHYSEAKPHYAAVLATSKAGSRGLAAYRTAWCELNQGQIQAGLDQFKQILVNPDLQTKSGVRDGQADSQFLEEVSLDFATWLARGTVSPAAIDDVLKLSPKAVQQSNMIALASELDRTGKKTEAVLVWKAVQDRAPQPEVRLEAQVRIVPMTFSSQNTEPALKNFSLALQSWKDLGGCGKKDCTDLTKTLRGFVVNWNQTEKKAPSENLQKAYGLYLAAFPADIEMAQWAAQVARDRSSWAESVQMYELAAKGLGPKDAERLESVLLSALEVAELSKNKELWAKTAQNYLSMSIKKNRVHEVKYQQARNIYEAGNYQVAVEQLKALAMDPTVPQSLRVQGAHLSLDALNLMKDDAGLMAQAKVFAELFKGADGVEFKKIQFKATMNDVAKIAGGNSAEALRTLSSVDLSVATPEDRKLFLKNKIVLAERERKFDTAASATEDYLALTGLTAEEREFGLAKKAWFSELRLDFATALKATENLKTTLKPDQKALKLAIYADLSGAESDRFYQQYLSLGADPAIKTAIATQMVRRSKQPLQDLTKHAQWFNKDPELLSRLYAEIYVKNEDPKLLQKILDDKRIIDTAWGKTFRRIKVLALIQPQTQKLADMKVDTKTQKTLAATIKSRAAELDKMEKLTQQTVDLGDWTSQLVSLSVLARESERFYQELLSLPMPEGLTPEQESEYLGLLTQQASPYKSKSDIAKTKCTELWATAGWSQALQKSMDDAGEFQSIVKREVDALKAVAANEQRVALEAIQPKATQVNQARPTRIALESARDELRQSPMSEVAIQKLLDLEKRTGDFAMVRYLEERLRGGGNTSVQEKTL